MDKQGRLTDDDLAEITSLLETRLSTACWNCGERDWLIFPTLLGEEFFDRGGEYLTSASIGPKVRLTCRNCGNIIYFAADALGFGGAHDG